MEKYIEHIGTVSSIAGNSMVVRIVTSSACAQCTAKSHCSPSESAEKDITINQVSENYVCGEKVRVVMHQSMGFKALCVGYVIPCILVIVALLCINQQTNNELLSGIYALAILPIYYLIIRLFRHKIDRTFGFQVKKIN